MQGSVNLTTGSRPLHAVASGPGYMFVQKLDGQQFRLQLVAMASAEKSIHPRRLAALHTRQAFPVRSTWRMVAYYMV
jgi:hypothetical protein